MKPVGTGSFSYSMEITEQDCSEHGIDFDLIKEYILYRENKALYDKIPDYYFEPPAQPKKPGLFEKLFKKKKVKETKSEKSKSQFEIELDAYYQKKWEELLAKGLKPYSKADLVRLYQNEDKLFSLIIKYADLESQKEQPAFINRGNMSYRYEISKDNNIIYYIDTAINIL